jgi:hypothetical protein
MRAGYNRRPAATKDYEWAAMTFRKNHTPSPALSRQTVFQSTMAAARRSAATALIRGELKGVYLLTTPTIRNAKAIVRSTTRQR